MNTIAFQRPASCVSHMRRPLNCDFETSLEKRCPHCKQNHLTPGYCQALDPINANNEQGANADEDKSERRKAYQRELMRKRRAEGKA